MPVRGVTAKVLGVPDCEPDRSAPGSVESKQPVRMGRPEPGIDLDGAMVGRVEDHRMARTP